MDWETLIDEAGVAALLPGEYARFARPVREGLVHFLSGLGPEQQATVLYQQALLGPEATTAQRLGEFARACPVLHKLGQTLARDHRLAAELREHLRPLESLPPTTPLAPLEQEIVAELGPLERLGVRLEVPIAEASVAIVASFTYGSHQQQRGVFKILKPGIEERLHQELGLLRDVGHYLDERCHQLGIPELEYREAFEQVSSKLAWEIRLDEEQRHLELANQLYANDPQVRIPAVLDFCSPRITAMEFVDGAKVSDYQPDAPGARRRLAGLVFRTAILRPLFARGRTAIFHGDPHPGNVLRTVDGRVALLDWSLATWLDEGERSAIIQIMLAAAVLNRDKIEPLLRQLSQGGRVEERALRTVIQANLLELCRGRPPGLTWLIGLLDNAAQQARLRPSPDMMLFRKALLTLEGTVGDIDRSFKVDDAVFREFVSQFLAETPRRCFQRFCSRALPTRVSNADLTELMLSAPLAPPRYWLTQWAIGQ